MDIKAAENPKGQILFFYEDKHIYLDHKEKRLTSVSRLVSSAFSEFDAARIAPRSAAKERVSVEVILKRWKKAREDGAALGSNVHKFAECVIKGFTLPKPINAKAKKYFAVTKKFITQMLGSGCVFIATEIIVFDADGRLAGTFDGIYKHLKSGRYFLFDWKTNKEIKMFNNYQKGKGPLKHLDDCNFVRYSLQMNLYRHILIKEQYFPVKNFDMILFHITGDGVVPYIIEPMDAEVELLVKGEVK